jgi:hypothetical protein
VLIRTVPDLIDQYWIGDKGKIPAGSAACMESSSSLKLTFRRVNPPSAFLARGGDLRAHATIVSLVTTQSLQCYVHGPASLSSEIVEQELSECSGVLP